MVLTPPSAVPRAPRRLSGEKFPATEVPPQCLGAPRVHYSRRESGASQAPRAHLGRVAHSDGHERTLHPPGPVWRFVQLPTTPRMPPRPRSVLECFGPSLAPFCSRRLAVLIFQGRTLSVFPVSLPFSFLRIGGLGNAAPPRLSGR
jgi:hypothetical protein